MNQENQAVARAQTAAADASRGLQPQVPDVDVFEDADGITLRADMPGVPREQLQVQVDADTLTLRGELRVELPPGMAPFYAELRNGAWERSFTLSRELDTQAIQATMKDGVLELRIPKAEHAKPRRVQVELG
ncbi:MAG: Hsp20/alpha crystallin family protein [Betaproteobacteria bacterium]|nr:Hsp20/alpha crystallin family protein [Betaproteobacteria bacterium]